MKKEILIITLIMFMTSTISNMAHPVTPELADSLGLGPFMFSVMFAAMAFANFIMSPVWGRLSDKNGRKKYLMIGPIGYGLAQLGFGFSQDPSQIIIFRLLAGGIVSASFVVGLAYLIDVTSVEERSKAFAFYTAITGFGKTLGYFIGGLIGDVDYHNTFIAQAIASLLSVIIIYFVVKDTNEKQITKKEKISLIEGLKKYQGTGLTLLLLVVLLTTISATGFNNSFNFYMKNELLLGPKEIGYAMAISGIIGLIVNIFIFPFLHNRYSDFKLLVGTLIFMAITLGISTYFISQLSYVVVFIIIFFGLLAMYRPLLQSMISKFSKSSNGEIMGLNNSANAVGMVIGSLVIGSVYEIDSQYAFYAVVLVIFIGFTLLINSKNRDIYE